MRKTGKWGGGSEKKAMQALHLRLFLSSQPCNTENGNGHIVIRFVEYEEGKCMQFGDAQPVNARMM